MSLTFLLQMPLEQGAISSVSACMQDNQVTAMIIVYRYAFLDLQITFGSSLIDL